MKECIYDSPLGKILLSCDDEGLTGLSLQNDISQPHEESSHRILNDAKRWLDIYFAGNIPDFTPALSLKGTSFQLKVWKALEHIPYGHTTTYKAIAKELGCKSAQAIGQAVGRNPISIIIPCHRVLGSDGSLTGYGGGLERKAALLSLEGTKNPSR